MKAYGIVAVDSCIIQNNIHYPSQRCKSFRPTVKMTVGRKLLLHNLPSWGCPHSVSLQLHNLRCHIVTERLIMLHEQDGWLVLLQHCLDLHAGDDVDVVHWLVPDVKVHGFADGTGEKDLFLLAGA